MEVVGGEVEVNGDDLTFVQFIKFLKTHNCVSKRVANALQVKGTTSTKGQVGGERGAAHGGGGKAAGPKGSSGVAFPGLLRLWEARAYCKRMWWKLRNGYGPEGHAVLLVSRFWTPGQGLPPCIWT